MGTETLEVKRVFDLLRKIDAKSVFLFCHHNADPDAIYSAYAFSRLLSRIVPSVDTKIIAPQGPSKLSKQVLNKIPIKIAPSPSLNMADAIILFDTSTLQQLNSWGKEIEKCGKPIIVIDHHVVHPDTVKLANLLIVDEHSSSTCEKVFKLFKGASINPQAEEAQALFIGMAYDTKHFSIASSNTFRRAGELIQYGANAEEALSLLEMTMENAERVARLKGGSRLQLVKLNQWLLAISRVSSYQASTARGLLSLGAHVAVVGGIKRKKLQINMRSSSQFYRTTKIHLGRDIAKPLGKYVKGMGGGHSTSAGVNGEGDVTLALNTCVSLFQEKISPSYT